MDNSEGLSDRFGNGSRRIGIRDIAAAAGVSITTVSHALNGKGRLPDPTRRRVLEVARQLGYRPNIHARGLRTGRSMILAVQIAGAAEDVIMPDAAYFVDVLNGASAEALSRGYGLVVAPASTPARQVGDLRADGAIVVDPTGAETLLTASAVPVVTTGRCPGAADGSSWVDNDHRAGTRVALDHLWDGGRRRPALLTTAARQSYVEDAIEAYTTWCRERGVPPRIARVPGSASDDAATEVTVNWLAEPQPPDAVHSTLDRLAAGALQAAGRVGRDVPGDLAVSAGSDAPMLGYLRPAVTALALHGERIGREAVALLVALVEGDESAPRQVTVESSLIVRDSTRSRGQM